MSSTERWEHLIAFVKSGIDELDSTKPFTNRCALYGGFGAALTQLEALVKEDFFDDGYAGEKLGQVRWSIEAALGIGTGNDHSDEWHQVHALGQLDSLEGKLNNLAKSES